LIRSAKVSSTNPVDNSGLQERAMAIVAFFSAANMAKLTPSVGVLNSPTSTQFTIAGPGTNDIYGGSFAYDGNSIVGTVASVTEFHGTTLTARISGLALDAAAIASLAQSAQLQEIQRLEFSGDDQVSIGATGSTILTFSGNDHISMAGGGNIVDGGTGIDTAIYSGKQGDYTVVAFGDTISVSTTGLATDALLGVERIKFSDATVAYDVNGNAGQAYRLYEAAYDRTPDQVGVSYWINAMDHGTTLKSVAQAFVTSGEFKAVYGANPTAAQVVNAFYTNVLGRGADSAGLDYWAGKMNAGMSLADVLVSFSESAENQAQSQAVILQGIVLDPHLTFV
jgi:hypothetical protein